MFSLIYIDTPFCNATIHKKSVFVLIMHLKFHIFYMQDCSTQILLQSIYDQWKLA